MWARHGDGRFRLVASYPILAVSGGPGPKRREGDKQVPEGFYEIDRFNPKSLFHLSLGLNYPNAADRVLSDREHPGGDIFIHGSNVTVGCAPLGNDAIEELYLAALDAPRPRAVTHRGARLPGSHERAGLGTICRAGNRPPSRAGGPFGRNCSRASPTSSSGACCRSSPSRRMAATSWEAAIEDGRWQMENGRWNTWLSSGALRIDRVRVSSFFHFPSSISISSRRYPRRVRCAITSISAVCGNISSGVTPCSS